MVDTELQIEGGNYTRIVNKVIEQLVKQPLLGAELAICLFIIRKTYGFQKKEDEISLTQFEQGTGRSRPTIVKALKNLQLVNIVKLVKKGDSRISSNCWSFNKYYHTWKLVKQSELVKHRVLTSKEIDKKLVKTAKHTKENYKRNTKETTSQSDGEMIVKVIDSFSGINPSYGRWYGNKTQRAAIDRLLVLNGIEQVQKVIGILEKTNGLPYFPTITTPVQLEEKWAQLESALRRKKEELKSKQQIFI